MWLLLSRAARVCSKRSKRLLARVTSLVQYAQECLKTAREDEARKTLKVCRHSCVSACSYRHAPSVLKHGSIVIACVLFQAHSSAVARACGFGAAQTKLQVQGVLEATITRSQNNYQLAARLADMIGAFAACTSALRRVHCCAQPSHVSMYVSPASIQLHTSMLGNCCTIHTLQESCSRKPLWLQIGMPLHTPQHQPAHLTLHSWHQHSQDNMLVTAPELQTSILKA